MNARRAIPVSVGLMLAAAALAAQVQMPNAREMSGVPLPAPELPAGAVTVRVVRGSPDNILVGQAVDVDVDGRSQTLRTGEDGRIQLSGLTPGSRVRAIAVVDGERLESQVMVIGATGLRVMLVATDAAMAAREADDRRLAAADPVKGLVVLGPETRVVVEMRDDRLEFFYVLQILNTARTPVDPGGPLVFDLPRAARGAGVIEGSSPQATVNGPRLTVTGPFAPGATTVQLGFELPYAGGTARLEQRWPAALQQLTVLAVKIGALDLVSRQIQSKRDVVDQGQPLIVGQGPAIAAGSALSLDITGLPHHARWPRYLALSLAGLITAAGLWAAFVPRRRA